MGHVRRWVCIVLVATMVASVMGSSPIGAQDGPETPPVEEPRPGGDVLPVDTARGPSAPREDLVISELPASEESKRPGWTPVVASVRPNADRPTKVGDAPVSVALRAADAARARQVEVNVLEPGYASQLSPFDAAVSVGFADNAGRAVIPDSAFVLELDLTDVGLGDSGNVQERLTVTRYSGCELFEPDLSGLEDSEIDPESVLPRVACEAADEIDADFDRESRSLTAKVDIPKLDEEREERQAALIRSGVPELDLDPKRGLERAAENAEGVLDPDGGRARRGADVADAAQDALENATPGGPKQMILLPHTRASIDIFRAQVNNPGGGTGDTYGLSTEAWSSSGDYSALPYPRLTDAQVGLYTGSAEISYPIPVPPAAAGPQPSVSFEYSSASIDGMTFGANNQVGPLGTGWSLAAGGSIQRALKPCAVSHARGDRCLSGSPDDIYTMSLAGRASRLVRVDTGGYPKEFRLESDPFWRIQLHSGGGVSTPDFLNEWWSVETPDGAVYTLGAETQSVDWLPVYYETTGNASGCAATYLLCDTAWKWNVDTVTDVYGNEMTYDYSQEYNWYNAREISTAYKRQYVKASRIESITYGANPGLSRDANARVVFNHEWRCGSTNAFSDCGDDFEDGFNDTPVDLWCGPHSNVDEYPDVCGEASPTFWTFMRLSGVLSQVSDGAGDWVTVANHDPSMSWARDTGESLLDSENQMVLDRVADRPIDANGTTTGGTYQRYGYDVLYAPTFDTMGSGQAGGSVNIGTATHGAGTESTVTSFHDEDWVMFEDVWLGDTDTPANEITLRASAYNSGSIEVRVGGATGTVIGTFSFGGAGFPLTSNNRDFETFTIDIDPAVALANKSGVKNIYLRGEQGTGKPISFINWVRFGHDPTLSLPEVAESRFTTQASGYEFLNNRIDHDDTGVSAIFFPRIKTHTNELGGTSVYTYGQDNQCPAGKSSGWDTNTDECFPVHLGPDEDDFGVFNKWTVQSMTRSDTFSSQPAVVTTYDYQSPAWAFANNPDSGNDTWNEFRGYNIVTVTDSAGKTEHRFHQGLDGGSILTNPPSFNELNIATVQRSDNTQIDDDYALRGRPYEVRRLTTGGTEITRDWSVYTNTATVSGYNNRRDPRFVAVSQSDSRVDQAASTRTTYTYNTWGLPLAINEQGNTASSTDNRTTVTRYYPDTTTSGLGDWRGPFPCVTSVDSGNSTTPPSTTNAATYDRWTQLFYDNNSTDTDCDLAVDKPLVRRSAVASSGSGRLTTVFAPDNRGRVITTTNPRGYSTTVTRDLLHGQIETTKNDNKNWTATTDYDDWRRPITSTDINGRITSTFYDEYSRVTAVRNPLDRDDGKDTVSYTYNQDARPAYVQTETRLNGNDYTNSATFVDGFGRTILNRYLAPDTGDNWATAMSYDNVGRPKYSSAQYEIGTDAVTSFAYPNWDNVPSFTRSTFDAASRPTGTQTRNGVDSADLVFDTSLSYSGFEVTFTDPNDDWTETTMDGLGRTLEVKEQYNNLDVDYTYNGAGDLLTVTAPDNAVTTMTYDRAGRKLTMDDPDTGLWTYTYNANSSLKSQKDPSNTLIEFAYDALERQTERKKGTTVLASWDYDPTSTTRGLLETATAGDVVHDYTYDTYARVQHVDTTIPEEDDTGTYEFRTTYTYRDDSQINTVALPNSTTAGVGETITYGYNNRTGLPTTLTSSTEGTIVGDADYTAAGQLASRQYGTAGANGVASFVYDSATLRLTGSLAGTTGDNNAWQDLEFFYDDNGNITRIFDDINADQHQCFTYDKIDRLLTAYTDNTSACNGHTALGDGNYNDTYAYTAGGNLGSRTGNGTYTYGDNDHKHAVTAMSANGGSSFTYDDNGNMETRNLAGEPDQTLNWDDEQRLESLEIEGGDTTEFLYDADGARVRRQTGDTTTFYTPVGSEYTITTSTGGGGNNPPTDTCYVQADGGGILLTWQDKAGSEVVRDSNGWVTTPPAGTLTYTDANGTVNDGWLIRRGGVDETCEIYVPGGGGNNPPTDTCYVQADGGGILLTWQDKAGSEVVRDSNGWVTTPPAGTLTYTNANGTVNDGWLIRRGGVDETCEIYVAGGGGGGTTTTKFVHYYQHSGDTVAYNDDGTVTWIYTDQINSTSLTRTGTTNSIQRYGPWGDLRTDGDLTTDRDYTGQIADNATGLAYYNARYYDPTTGRFISPDTIIPTPGNGQDYNRYSYVRNNPINSTDPTGHETCGTRNNQYVCWDDYELYIRGVVNADGSGGNPEDAYDCPYAGCVAPGRIAGHRSAPTDRDIAIGAFRLGVFDERECSDPSVGCGLQILGILPLAKIAKFAKLFKFSDEAADAARHAPSGLVPGPNGALRDPATGRFAANPSRVTDAPSSGVHGNSRLSDHPTSLYQLYDDAGNYLKTGVTGNPAVRYPSDFMRDKYMDIINTGSRSNMLDLERMIVEIDPGPLNLEPWAGIGR